MKAPLLNRLARLAQFVGKAVLGLIILGWVVDHVGPNTGEVVVHVVEADVLVTIDGKAYEYRGLDYTPIECELPAGRHEMVMRRGSRVLFEQSFELHSGEVLVLTAWDPQRRRGVSS